MATKAELVSRAASDMGLLPLGQTLNSAVQTRLNSAYDEVHAELTDEGIAPWASSGSCPTALTPYVASLIAYNCRDTFPISVERYTRIISSAGPFGENAKREIRRLSRTSTVSQEGPVDY